MQRALKEKILQLPNQPGIYLFKNADRKVIYIGKARLLKERVKSYFQSTSDLKINHILAETADIDYILTDSEREAAFLENNFIRQFQPKFNLRLKDDKSFPYLKLTVAEKFPGIYFSRAVKEDGAKYFGPFHPAREARKTIRMINKYFRVRGCTEAVPGMRKRPCLEYELKLCSAPCVGNVQEADYRESVENALLFLEGKTERLTRALRKKMRRAAVKEEFEEAAHWRDILQTLEQIKEKPKLISVSLENLDIFGYARNNKDIAVHVFLMRKGKVIESREFLFEEKEIISRERFLRNFLEFFYTEKREGMPTILLPFYPAGKESFIQKLSLRPGRKPELAVPLKGKYKALVNLAVRNAALLLQGKNRELAPLVETKRILGLKSLPIRIEGFDVSNTGGTETVASSVTFEYGRPQKDGYRKYIIQTVKGPNDVASLEEVIRRRYARVLDERKRLPDLILVDGGLPQLSAAQKTLKVLGLENLPLAALAKKQEIVFTSSRKQGLRLDRTSPALRLFQRIRDEAHRFAVSFHRHRRTKKSFEA
ncbi:MAG: excinuclease ABC subunit UvrC [Candidatus Aminicenantales bacterium]